MTQDTKKSEQAVEKMYEELADQREHVKKHFTPNAKGRLDKVEARMQTIEDSQKEIKDLVVRVLQDLEVNKGKILDVEAKAKGENPEFEKALRSAQASITELSDTHKELFGMLAPPALQDIVHSVLGLDVNAYVVPDPMLPQCKVSMLVPKRLSGMDWDFRCIVVSNASVDADVKKYCEKIKQNLFKTFQTMNKGVPKFLLAGIM